MFPLPSAPGAARGNSGMGSSMLDGPPPNPMNPAFSELQHPSLGAGAGSGQPPSSRDLPPEILMGILQSGDTIATMLDDMGAMVPDLAPDLAGARELLMRALAKITMQTGGTGAAQPSERFAGSAPSPGGLPPL